MTLSSAEIAGLVEPARVHRRVYTDPAVFELELERIFGGWVPPFRSAPRASSAA